MGIRQKQTASTVQRSITRIFQEEGGYIYGDALVTVTEVRMTPDMGIARIYLSVYNAHNKVGVIEAVKHNATRLRSILASRIRHHVRRIPFLEFYLDETLDEMHRLSELFNKLEADKQKSASQEEE